MVGFFSHPEIHGDTLLLGFSIIFGKPEVMGAYIWGFDYYKNHIVGEEVGCGAYSDIRNEEGLFSGGKEEFNQFIEAHKTDLSDEFKEVLEIWNRKKALAKAANK